MCGWSAVPQHCQCFLTRFVDFGRCVLEFGALVDDNGLPLYFHHDSLCMLLVCTVLLPTAGTPIVGSGTSSGSMAGSSGPRLTKLATRFTAVPEDCPKISFDDVEFFQVPATRDTGRNFNAGWCQQCHWQCQG